MEAPLADTLYAAAGVRAGAGRPFFLNERAAELTAGLRRQWALTWRATAPVVIGPPRSS
jgi:hypothetical protein